MYVMPFFWLVVFVQLLNDVSNPTDQFDKGCHVPDESFTCAHRMYRATIDSANTLSACGVEGTECGPLGNCPVCCPTPGACCTECVNNSVHGKHLDDTMEVQGPDPCLK